MANAYTGIYAKTLTAKDFDASEYDGIAVTAGIPVRLYYRVLPGQEIAFGNGSSSLGGVRTAKLMYLDPHDDDTPSNAVTGTYRLMYQDANKVRTTVLKEDQIANVNTAPTAWATDVAAQAAYLPETSGMTVGAYAYLVVEFYPDTTIAGQSFDIDATNIQLPTTVYTLANASGQ